MAKASRSKRGDPPLSKGDIPSRPRRNVDAWRDAQRAALDDLARRRGKVLFDGEWVEPDRVRRRLWRLRWVSLRMVLETLVLCAAFVLAAGVLWVLLVLMGGWNGPWPF